MPDQYPHLTLCVPEAERQLLAWCLRDPALIRRLRSRVPATDMSTVAHRWIWQTVCELDAEGLPVDPLAVYSRLEGQPVAEKAPLEMLRGFLDAPLLDGVDTCAQLITERALRRRLQAAAAQLAALSLDPDKKPEDLDAQARALVRGAVAAPGRFDKLHSPASRASAAFDRYTNVADAGAGALVPFGVQPVDELIGAARPGQFIVIAAASGHGKTAFMQVWAQHAGQAGKKALYFSAEMGEPDLTDREVARWTNIPLPVLRGRLDTGNTGRLFAGIDQVHASNIWVWDREPITPALIAGVADEMQATVGLDIIFVDYLQILKPDRELRDRRLEIEDISDGLRRLARTLNVPVVAGSQLSRAHAIRSDRRPRPEDLRESGKIYQDAWIVLGLYRPGAVRGETDPAGKQVTDDTIEVHVLKNRQDGPTNTFRTLRWDGPLTDVFDPTQPRLWQRLPASTRPHWSENEPPTRSQP